MGTSLYLGIDVGTYESKGVLMDGHAHVIASRSIGHVLSIPHPGYAEHDAEKIWWGDFCALSNGLIRDTGIEPGDISAVACSTIAPCCLPVDSELRPLRPAILYGIDVRSAKEVETIETVCGRDALIKRYGQAVSTQSMAPKILWLKNNEPEIFKKAHMFITGTTYLVAKLTGEYVVDNYTANANVPMFDSQKMAWGDVSMFCERTKLADCMWTTQIAGKVTAKAAGETGLLPGTRVIVGTADAAAEAVSVGVLNNGELMIMYGSSLFMILVSDRLHHDPRVWPGPYLFQNSYSIAAGMATTGSITRWYKDQFCPDISERAAEAGVSPYQLMSDLIRDVPLGSDGLVVLPYFSGERTPICDPYAKGVIFGLGLNHTRAHIYNACLESTGYGVSQHIDVLREMGAEPREIMAVGGGTKNRKWLQMVSDISGVSQKVPDVTIGAAYGDAMLAALAVGEIESPEQLKAFIRCRDIIRPDLKGQGKYAKLKTLYTELYTSTKHLMHML